jgi:hypothetical protein
LHSKLAGIEQRFAHPGANEAQIRPGGASMPDAAYLRSQAEWFRQMARGMRDSKVAGNEPQPVTVSVLNADGQMQRTLTLIEKWEIIEREWARARAKNPKVVLRVHVDDKTDESGNPRVCVVIAP